MGVSLISKSYNGPNFSYGGFMGFRKEICEYFGFGDLEDYYGFGGIKKMPSYKKYPIWQLLRHSDCEGTLKPTLGLLQDLKKIDKEIYGLNKFIELCEFCIRNNEIIKFI